MSGVRTLTVFGLLLIAVACGRSVEGGPPDLPDLPEYPIEICGWVTDAGAAECFIRARNASLGAELFSTIGTVEGDPIYQIFRSTPAGEIEVYVDDSADKFRGDYPSHRILVCADFEFIDNPAGFTVAQGKSCSETDDEW